MKRELLTRIIERNFNDPNVQKYHGIAKDYGTIGAGHIRLAKERLTVQVLEASEQPE